MNKSASRLTVVLLLAAMIAGAAYYWWVVRPAAAPAVQAVMAPAAQPAAVEAPAALASEPAKPEIEFPVEAMMGAEPNAQVPALPALAQADPFFREELTGLLGRKKVLTFLQLDVFARRVVATVDNLARSHAAWSLWPVNPTAGRFTVQTRQGKQVISPDNSLRYAPFVQFVESVNTGQVVKFYARAYPLFQKTYEELGYPGKYFNDRLVAVIDHLLTTPVQTGPIEVRLVEVKGSVPSLRPWVRYEYSDPALEAMSAGQKMLVRSGPVNHRRLQAKLREFRGQIVGASIKRP